VEIPKRTTATPPSATYHPPATPPPVPTDETTLTRQGLVHGRSLRAPADGSCANLMIYDASYVALAEALNSELLTGDARLTRAIAPVAASNC
jgi:hypothetical protein